MQATALVATDFSPMAQRAADRAAVLALAQGQPLQLLHVVNHDWMVTVRGWLGDQGPVLARLAEASAVQLEAEGQRLRSQFPGLSVTVRLLEGQPVAGVHQAASDLPAAWVVLGVRGSTPLDPLQLGNTAERLLRKTTHPLLVVRQPVTGPYQRVLVPVDFSPWSQAALALALGFAPQAQLVLMHSFGVPFEEKLRFAGVDDDTVGLYRDRARLQALALLQGLAEQTGLPPQRLSLCLQEGDAARDVVTQAEARGCDLVVIGKHGRNAAEELLLGSVTKHVLAEVGCDVLVSTGHATA